MVQPNLRVARLNDADSIAVLHADSWRRHYRGAYADSFLDGDVVEDRRRVWSARLAAPSHSVTLVAELESELAGFVHIVFAEDDRWGSLVDNLHVSYRFQGKGIGTALMIRGSEAVEAAGGQALYLWVLEQNVAAQGFYRSLDGRLVEKSLVEPPGGVPGRLTGSPHKLRFYWPDVRLIISSTSPD